MLKFLQKILHKKPATDSVEINLKAIEKNIGYKFSNRNILAQAFRHRSYLIIRREPAHRSNERLEFLGDAVLDLVVTEFLYNEMNTESEGVLSKMKSVLVSRKVLAQIVSGMKLGEHLLLNRGEEQTGGRKRLSNLANLYESVLGAVYLDGGLKSARIFIQQTLLNDYDTYVSDEDHLNYKSMLLEYAQARGMASPKYLLIRESGPDHEKIFEIEVILPGSGSAMGSGRSKKIAEQDSAQNLLREIAPEIIDNSVQS